MDCEEYGRENPDTIVFLHGANFIHCFSGQYHLSERFHLMVPHIQGFGNEADRVFTTESAVAELAEWIRSRNQKVTLVGFSLGAQLGAVLAQTVPEALNGAILVSPWLIKEQPLLDRVMKQNEKQLTSLQKKWFCRLVGRMNGMSSEIREEFVEQMQHVKPETIRNAVDNRIVLKDICHIPIPVIALAGQREPDAVKQSVIGLAEQNPDCRYEIWGKAAHNIPLRCATQLSELIERVQAHTN